MNVFIYNKDYDFSDSLFCEEIDITAEDGEKFVRHAEHESQFAALREELAVAKSDISTWRIHHDRKVTERDDLQQRLADAERRNSVMRDALSLVTDGGFDPDSGSGSWGAVRITLEDYNIIQAALNPNPEAASHDE